MDTAEQTSKRSNQMVDQTTNQKLESNGEGSENEPVKLRLILLFSIVVGLTLNFMQTYIRITMGLLGIGVGTTFAVLLLAKFLLRKRQGDTKRNFTIIAIAYGATQAAEASIGMLFIIWLVLNASAYGITFSPPSWLIPSFAVLNARNIFSSEWIVPIFVHLFLMLVPGIIGLLIGWILKNKFIKNEEEYPFPGVVQQQTSIEVLTTKANGKAKLFKKWIIIGFIFSLLTYPFFALDLSSPSNGYLMGLTLGPIGLALFSGGFIINRQSITIPVALSSLLAYTILSPFVVGQQNLPYFTYFNDALQMVYLSAAIGLLLGGVIAGPIIIGFVKNLIPKKTSSNSESTENEQSIPDTKDTTEEKPDLEIKNINKPNFKIINLFISQKWVLGLLLVVYTLALVFVFNMNIFGSTDSLLIILMLFWIVIIGGFVNGFLMVSGSSKTGAVVTPPFIFDEIPIFLSGASGYLPYLATPRSESDGTLGLIRSLKLASVTKLDEKLGLISYLTGYFASSLTTPFFAILLFATFGIGTEQLPAPAFPVQGAIISAFASRSIETVLSISQLLLGAVGGLFLAIFGSNIALGFSLGIFFPPHMALCLTLGGLTRYTYGRKYGKETADKNAPTIGTALAVGGSFVIPIMVLLALI